MFTFPTAPHPHPKEQQIATLNNKVYNINYSSHKSSNNVSAKHICTTIRACESLLLPERLFLWQDLYGVSTNAALPLKCYVPHVCARLTGYRSCFHMLWPTPQNALATSLQVSWKEKKQLRRGQTFKCNNSFPSVPIKMCSTKPTRYQQPWQQSLETCLCYVTTTFKTTHLSLGTSRDSYTNLPPPTELAVGGWDGCQHKTAPSAALTLRIWGSKTSICSFLGTPVTSEVPTDNAGFFFCCVLCLVFVCFVVVFKQATSN